MKWCTIDHKYGERFEDLEFDEDSFKEYAKHKCVGCAYDQGYDDGSHGRPRHLNLDTINFTTAEIVRHKSPKAAYDMGYDEGFANYSKSDRVNRKSDFAEKVI